ncbi:aldo/keto reductase [Pontimonas sp.]|uniref:aldo/keto reductase n=1 Tax=Pontimonas sp. TaxID=2304492 RepID=UPI00286FE56B|nr:aldo/keto reductase [Pontimonas sp.]MDR9396262.1 aldo/keto reductase [Pontimonas sp.]MDR9434653.1 aldo/keto reductase [Pontimonas sp.]
MTSTVPELTLNSGYRIPQLGLGVFLVPQDEAQRVVTDALEVGYRHIDNAAVYRNEEGVGRALAESGIARDELFITTKLWNTEQGSDAPRPALEESLEKLGLDYVDLYLIHWPAPQRDLYVESWQALEQLRDEGLVRSIGVSNFEPEHLDRLAEHSSVIPAVNQVELHPALQQRELRGVQEPRGILTEAWGPLGQAKYALEEMPGLSEIATKHSKTLPQVILRWHIQEGVIVFPKTTKKERLKENFEVFDFELDASDMAAMKAMDQGMRVGTHPNEGNW